ncbi:hypothetical protein KC571_00710 [candidate division WWE3 bacterium]|uniref:Uncharacterized protein n=1 Tax=candidate division WWE3 bacterium TaxID=2053526 RepID=A0A955LGB8_UNCKA|nr:hypothetical protein [candidate division WWE3 bacterium]
MTNYTQGAVIGAATTLPATTAAGLIMLNRANAWIIAGLLLLTGVNLVLSAAMISRYLINKRRANE